MEGITRLVSESLARHGFDRPLDYRRLHWSRWFRCESLHSLLFVPSQPGVFALAEEVMELAPGCVGTGASPSQGCVGTGASPVQGCVGTDAFVRPAKRSEATLCDATPNPEGHDFSRAERSTQNVSASAADGPAANSTRPTKRMLAVTQFFEDDDMAFVLDRMLSRHNPMRNRLLSGRYFVRFVVIEEAQQRRSICAALNQWIANSGEKASSGIGAHFATSLELTETNVAASVARTLLSATAESVTNPVPNGPNNVVPAAYAATPQPDSGAATNPHRPAPFPSGF